MSGFILCPRCGKWLTINLGSTWGFYQCNCGYDSRNENYSYASSTTEPLIDLRHKCPNCGHEFND